MSGNGIHTMLLENLPTEIFLQIFSFLSLNELSAAFSSLNSYIDSVIQSIRGARLVVKYKNIEAINLLQLFPDQISRLAIINVEMVDFTSLTNLRSLTLKYGTEAQYNSIRPEHFPLLEILHITGFHRTVTNGLSIGDNLLQVLLSNGFPRLRICRVFDMTWLLSSDTQTTLNERWAIPSSTWTGSPTLQTFNLFISNSDGGAKIRSLCPQLSQFTTDVFPMNGFTVPDSQRHRKRIFYDIRKLERLETENKLIIDVNPVKSFRNRTIPPRFNNTTITERPNTQSGFVFQARILPQSEPYCQASFVIEIVFPSEYPFKPPNITFLDPIYHPRIHESGTFCYSCDSCNGFIYDPRRLLVDIIEYVIYLIDNISDSYCVLNRECFEEYMNNHPMFYRKALECTLTYGRPRY